MSQFNTYGEASDYLKRMGVESHIAPFHTMEAAEALHKAVGEACDGYYDLIQHHHEHHTLTTDLSRADKLAADNEQQAATIARLEAEVEAVKTGDFYKAYLEKSTEQEKELAEAREMLWDTLNQLGQWMTKEEYQKRVHWLNDHPEQK